MRLFLVKYAKQLGLISLLAVVGLSSGAVVAAARGTKKIAVVPSPAPSLVLLAEPSPLPTLVLTPSPVPSPSPQVKKTSPVPTKAAVSTVKRAFNWGVNLNTLPFPNDSEKFLEEQFRLATELGVHSVRVDYRPTNQSINQQAVELAKKQNLQLIFIIPFGPNDIFSDPDLSNNTYSYVKDAVGKYKGQVAVWQLATEVASVAIVDGGHHGVDQVDYPEAKYQAVATWLKAAARGVKDADPNAKRLVNDQWVHVGFFDRFLKEGGDFDILGWNWFSDMGTNIDSPVINSQTNQHYNLMAKLKSFNKEIWLTEVNRRRGSADGNESAQASYIQTMAESAYRNPTIKGFFVYDLVHDITANSAEQGYGLVRVDPDTHFVAGLKPAFNTYHDLIKAKN